MKISVNCPSYKRPKVETLDYLPYCKVWVAESEYMDYLVANKGFENNIIKVPNDVQGNLCRIRNYILDKELPDNDCVLIIDDDMRQIYRYESRGMFGYTQCLRMNCLQLLKNIQIFVMSSGTNIGELCAMQMR